MGDPKKKRKKFEKPKRLWDKERIEEDKKLKEEYGLKNMRELWRLQTIIRKKRQNARKLLALPAEQRTKREKELLNSLERLGVLNKGAVLDDVLALTVRELIERRLQTIVLRKNLANTIKQARQFITHGHISVKGRKTNCPGCFVPKNEEETISWSKKPIALTVKLEKSREQLKREFEEVGKAEPIRGEEEKKVKELKEVKEEEKEKTVENTKVKVKKEKNRKNEKEKSEEMKEEREEEKIEEKGKSKGSGKRD